MEKQHQYRHEVKYLINNGIYHILRQRFKAFLKPDANTVDGKYRITSLYFDDIYRSAYSDKNNGVLNRKKYRIRAYNFDKSFIRLEEKVKDDNVGYKKSSRLTFDEYERILSGDVAFLSAERFADSAGGDFFASASAVGLKPAVIVDYLREPYICREGNIRLTFDMNISACGNSLDIFDEKAEFYPVFDNNEIVLEVKYDNFIPEYISSLIYCGDMLQESVSKYVMCCDKYRSLNYGL